MESIQDFHTAKALLEWQFEMGVTEAIGETPVNRYDLPGTAPRPGNPVPAVESAAVPAAMVATEEVKPDPVAVAQGAAGAADTLEDLEAALGSYTHCELRLGARNLVFADGNPQARVMVIGEAPGRDEDIQGKPFVGPAGQLLDRMFAAIGMGRTAPDARAAIYITNILPWRPPQNRDPKPGEIAMMQPFIARHIELVAPDVLVLMGNHSCQALLGRKGITRMRGSWARAQGLPCLPMFHPAYLLRNPASKREAWHDLLMLKEKLRGN